MLLGGWQRINDYFHIVKIIPLQLSLSNPSYTIINLISIAEHGSVELTPLTLSQTVKLSFFHKFPKQV